MRDRLIVFAAGMLAAVAQAAGEGEEIFNQKCSACHTFGMAQEMLVPKSESERVAYLETFLQSHPAMLEESEKAIVIEALSKTSR